MGLDGALAQDELLGNEGRTPSLGIEHSYFHLSGSQSVLGSKGVPDIHVRRSGEGALGATAEQPVERAVVENPKRHAGQKTDEQPEESRVAGNSSGH